MCIWGKCEAKEGEVIHPHTTPPAQTPPDRQKNTDTREGVRQEGGIWGIRYLVFEVLGGDTAPGAAQDSKMISLPNLDPHAASLVVGCRTGLRPL